MPWPWPRWGSSPSCCGRDCDWATLLLGALAGLVLEPLQLLLASGTSQGLSVLTRGLGLVLGALAGQSPGAPGAASGGAAGGAGRPLPDPALSGGHAVGLGLVRRPAVSPAAALARLSEVRWLPLYYQYYTTEAMALASALAQFALYAPFGLLAWAWAARAANRRWTRGLDRGGIVLPLSLLIEAGKLFFPPAHPDPTNSCSPWPRPSSPMGSPPGSSGSWPAGPPGLRRAAGSEPLGCRARARGRARRAAPIAGGGRDRGRRLAALDRLGTGPFRRRCGASRGPLAGPRRPAPSPVPRSSPRPVCRRICPGTCLAGAQALGGYPRRPGRSALAGRGPDLPGRLADPGDRPAALRTLALVLSAGLAPGGAGPAADPGLEPTHRPAGPECLRSGGADHPGGGLPPGLGGAPQALAEPALPLGPGPAVVLLGVSPWPAGSGPCWGADWPLADEFPRPGRGLDGRQGPALGPAAGAAVETGAVAPARAGAGAGDAGAAPGPGPGGPGGPGGAPRHRRHCRLCERIPGDRDLRQHAHRRGLYRGLPGLRLPLPCGHRTDHGSVAVRG